MEKKEIRKLMISRRDAISENERYEFSDRIAERLFSITEYINATTVLSYASFGSEVITDKINRRIIEDGKKLYLPKVYMKEHRMRFIRVEDMDTDMAPGAMGIREPIEDEDKTFFMMNMRDVGSDPEYRDVSDRVDIPCKNVRSYKETPDEIFVIMPCVAFDGSGNRLGYGGGFYDRFLFDFPDLISNTVLLAYEAQRAENIPTEPCDIKPKLFLTERGIL
ncbi:MAG: 5-formyltetrahydrofolate cyclo-ligase [Eubacterium sp.]|nr:5-formyltetrahydrofolate cyclo-ligase [Eubacterium sp.]